MANSARWAARRNEVLPKACPSTRVPAQIMAPYAAPASTQRSTGGIVGNTPSKSTVRSRMESVAMPNCKIARLARVSRWRVATCRSGPRMRSDTAGGAAGKRISAVGGTESMRNAPNLQDPIIITPNRTIYCDSVGDVFVPSCFVVNSGEGPPRRSGGPLANQARPNTLQSLGTFRLRGALHGTAHHSSDQQRGPSAALEV